MTSVFATLSRENKMFFIVDDFNFNILDYSSKSNVKHFINFMLPNGMLSVINKPTRASLISASCIDHIYTQLLSYPRAFSRYKQTRSFC